MGNGKKINGHGQRRTPRPAGPEPKPAMREAANAADAAAEPMPDQYVIVLAYDAPQDGEVEEDFGQLVENLKALFTFRGNLRSYALVDAAAKRVLAKVEKPTGEPSGKAAIVISYDQPASTKEGFDKTSNTLERVRDIFADETGVEVRVAIRESADEVLDIFDGGKS